MNPSKCTFRYYCLTESKRGKSAKAIHQNLATEWNKETPGLSTVKRWVKEELGYGTRSFLEDLPRSGRPVTTRTDHENISRLVSNHTKP